MTPKFTQRHYIAIGDILKYCRPSKIAKPKGYIDRVEEYQNITEELVKAFEADNPLFDQAKFINYINQK